MAGEDVSALMRGGSIAAGTDVSALMGGSSSKKTNLNSLEGAVATAEQNNLGAEARALAYPEKQLSLLQRVSAAVGAFNPAEAALRASEGKNFALEYPKTIIGGLASGVTGTADYNEGRRSFMDVVDKYVPKVTDALLPTTQNDVMSQAAYARHGATKAALAAPENVARWALGTGADIGLDPTTYVGGEMAGLAAKGIVKTGDKALDLVAKVAPKAVEAGERGATAITDALGKGFVHGYGTSAGVKEHALELQGTLSKGKQAIGESNKARLADALTEEQQAELVSRAMAGKTLERKLQLRAEREQARKAQATMADANKDASVRAIGMEMETGSQTVDNPAFGVHERSHAAHELADKVDDALTAGEGQTRATSQAAQRAGIDTMLTGSKAERRGLRAQMKGAGPQAQTVGLQDPAVRYAKEAAANLPDSPLARVASEQIERNREFAKLGGIEDPMAAYFPSLKADTAVKVQKFLEGTSGMQLGAQGYKKRFLGKIKDAELNKNLPEVYARREYEIFKDAESLKTMKEIVRDSGRPANAFKNDTEAAAAGYVRLMSKGQRGETLGFLKQADKKFIDDLVKPESSVINNIARATGYDAVTGLFKRSVTGLFPSFHTRNYVSGHLQNFEVLGHDALNPVNIADGHRLARAAALGEGVQGTIRVAGGREVPLAAAAKPFEKRFGGASRYISDFGDEFSKESKSIVDSLKSTKNPLAAEGPVFKRAREVGNYIETQQKATAYITALRQGKTVPEALELAAKAGFDYRALTKFESQILRRIVPFYAFSRKNVELQLKTAGTHPERINQILTGINNIGESPSAEEQGDLPPYMQKQLTAKMGDTKSGKQQYITGFGTALEQATDTLEPGGFLLQKVGQMNPLLKTPIESTGAGFGKDAFRNRDIQDTANAEDYRGMPEVFKKWIGYREVTVPVRRKDAHGKWKETGEFRTEYVADPDKLHILRNMPTSRLANTISKLFDKDVDAGTKALSLMTGLKVQQIDLEAVRSSTERDRTRAVQDLLTRYRVGYRMQRYLPAK